LIREELKEYCEFGSEIEIFQVTDKFKDISKEIIDIKKKLDTHHSDTNLGNLIGRVQVQIKKIGWLVGSWIGSWIGSLIGSLIGSWIGSWIGSLLD